MITSFRQILASILVILIMVYVVIPGIIITTSTFYCHVLNDKSLCVDTP